MPAVREDNKKERLNFFIDRELLERVNEISKRTKMTVSEIARKALTMFIDLVEKERIEKELEAGYKANYAHYIDAQEEWKNADKR